MIGTILKACSRPSSIISGLNSAVPTPVSLMPNRACTSARFSLYEDIHSMSFWQLPPHSPRSARSGQSSTRTSGIVTRPLASFTGRSCDRVSAP